MYLFSGSNKFRESLQDKFYEATGIKGKTNGDPALIVHSVASLSGTYPFILLIKMASSQQIHRH